MKSDKLLKWIKDLFSAVNQILSEWVNSYHLFSREKIEAETLIYYDTVNDLWAAAAHQVKKSKLLWIEKNTFEFSFTDKNTEFL